MQVAPGVIELGAGRRVTFHPDRRLVVIGAGKAAAPMAAATIDALGRVPDRGVVVTKDGHAVDVPGCTVLESAHPVPDERCIAAADALVATCADLDPEDLVLCCLTGGASALIGAPATGIPLADQARAVELLLASGAEIQAVNRVRRHLTRLGGGGLVAAAAPARVLTLAVSDVLGNDPAAIGSGPTCADPSTYGEAIADCQACHIWDELPQTVRAYLSAGEAGDRPETIKPGDRRLTWSEYEIVASNRDAIVAVVEVATAAGLRAESLGHDLVGDATAAGRAFAAQLLERRGANPRCALIGGGETTVILPADHGRGGRNQQFALAAAEVIRGQPVTILAAGTDGTDGPTDAAGAIVDGDTWDRIPDAAGHLERCDAYPALDRAGCLVRTGPTGTNVMDIAIGLTNDQT